jgi:serine/threonine protein kinase
LSERRIGDYVVTGDEHHGSYGTVCIAKHEKMPWKRAIKQLHDHVRPEVIIEEARKQQAVKSPFVVQIYEFLTEHNAILMEYCPTGLDEYLLDHFRSAEGDVRYDDAREILHSVLQGLNDAHKAGLIHGDIKPANVRRGEDGLWKIGDFGAARRLRETTTILRGSNNWMAPEVLLGGDTTQESDYFSFGVLAYLVLSGRHPFYADDPSCLTSEQDNIRSSTFTPVPLSALCPSRPCDVANLVMELLSREQTRAKAEQSLKAALAVPPEEETGRPSVLIPVGDQPTPEEVDQLEEAYQRAREDFFQWYRPKLAVEDLTAILEEFRWSRFKDSRLSRLADAWSLRAYINNSGGFFDDAVEAASNGLIVHPDHVNSLHARAYAYIQLGKYDGARQDLEAAIELTGDPRKREQLYRLLATLRVREPV